MQITNATNRNADSITILGKLKDRVSSIFGYITSSPKITVGVGVVVFFVLIAIAAPLLTPYDPNASLVKGSLSPSSAHIFGTSGLGQDIFAQLVYGARVTLLVGFVAAIGSTILQIVMGLSSAYYGGIVDEVLSLIINVFLVLPGLPLTIVLASLASASGANKNEFVIALVLLFTSWSYGARVLRAQTLSLKEREFVAAARSTGESSFRIISSEILPNEVSLIASTFIGTFVYAVGAEVALEFLGLGDTSRSSWGVILYWAQNDGALIVYYETGNLPVHAVNDVSFTLHRGQIMGLAGESGSGKSTLAYAITRLLRTPAKVSEGEIWYYPKTELSLATEKTSQQQNHFPWVKRKEKGRDNTRSSINVLELSPAQLRAFRWQELAIVFQSAMNALNPVMRLEKHITDVLKAHDPSMESDALRQRALELLRLVGITPDRLRSYPHELSGGMRQRAIIAIALALNPDIIIMDEPTTALDVVVQRDILVEMMALREQLSFAIIFITHDLSLLLEIADQVVIMYAGRIVETAPWQELYRHPRHPYTYGLLNSFPSLHGPKKKMIGIPGSPPDLRHVPLGCAYHLRCPFAFDTCRERIPNLEVPQVAGTHMGDQRLEPDSKLEGDVKSSRSQECQVACHLYSPAHLGGHMDKALQNTTLEPQANNSNGVGNVDLKEE